MTDHDTAANIARLTGQVETLRTQLEGTKACRDREVMDRNREISALEDAIRKSDAQRDELQSMVTACEECETQQRERAKKAEAERDEHYRKLLNYWATYGGCSDATGEKFVQEKEALRERVKKLVEVLRWAKANVKTEAIWCLSAIDAALAPAPPAETPAPRKFLRIGASSEACANCGRHIRNHYGGLEYRCRQRTPQQSEAIDAELRRREQGGGQ